MNDDRDAGESTADPAVILRVHYAADPPGRNSYFLARQSMAARMAADAPESGHGDDVENLGQALQLCQPATRAEFTRGEMILIGVAQDGRWVTWRPPWAPVEPVPGSPGATGARN